MSEPVRIPADREMLAAIFASRVTLAKKTEDEAAADARKEWQRNQKWITSPSQKEGSFLWFADEFDIPPDAILRAIRERK